MKLDAFLKANDLTDAEFAAMIGKDRSSVTRLRAGTTSPSWDTAIRIAKVTNGIVTPNDFLPANALTTEHPSPFPQEAAE